MLRSAVKGRQSLLNCIRCAELLSRLESRQNFSPARHYSRRYAKNNARNSTSDGNRDVKSMIDELIRPVSLMGSAVPQRSRNRTRNAAAASHHYGGVSSQADTRTDVDIGQELSGVALTKRQIADALAQFSRRAEIRGLAAVHGIGDRLFANAFKEFRYECLERRPLPPDLHVLLSDIVTTNATVSEVVSPAHVDALFPYFLECAYRVYPHLECLEELEAISDLREPHAWFPQARAMRRRIIYHSGPTNSGKTYQALQRYMDAKSGVYCGPLKLLASEVYHKTNAAGVPCDLITGEERKFANVDQEPAEHVSCTVEMVNTSSARYEVAVIDEIQMLRDSQRGWAWTRAILGVCADEIHVCGEAAAIPLLRAILEPVGESVDVSNRELGSLENVQEGDCVVCFGRGHVYAVSRELEAMGYDVAVIYGSLPPGTKLAQAARFNDPDDPCKVLVSTDAIGMGLNLSIRRVIFHSLQKPTGDARAPVAALTASQAKQIGGRAGRFGTTYEAGEVTTLHKSDLMLMQELIDAPVERDTQAGLHPTFDQIELFSYHLPHASLVNLLEVFKSICSLDHQLYFLCQLDTVIELAEMLEQTRYTFCLAPIPRNAALVSAHFVRFAKRFASGRPLDADWLRDQIDWPLAPAKSLSQMEMLEHTFDVLDLYLWLGQRYEDMFPDCAIVREMQQVLDLQIQEGVKRAAQLASKSAAFPDASRRARKRSKLTQMIYHHEESKRVSDPDESQSFAGSGSVAAALVQGGVLSEAQLKALQKEFEMSVLAKSRRRKNRGNR